MHILFAVPPSSSKRKIIRMIDCSHEAKANYLWQPNDFIIISSLLGAADSAALVDATADEMSAREFLSTIASLKPDLVFFALSSVCWGSDFRVYEAARRILPDAAFFVLGDIFIEEEYRRAVFGGCGGIIVNPYILDLAAMAVAKPGSGPLPGVINAASPDWHVLKTPLEAASSIPRHELFLKSGYRFPFARKFRHATVTTLWGCPFSCSYCADSQIGPVVRRWRDVVAELEYLKSLNVSELFFADKAFGFSAKNAVALLEAMAQNFSFSWSCYFHPQLYAPRLLELMKAAGCHTIITGIDSADMESLKHYGRGMEREKTEAFLRHADSLGLDVCADFILGLEHEDAASIRRTIDYALKMPLDYASFNIAAPLPGSDIRRRAKESGRMRFGQEGFDTFGYNGVINPKISGESLKKLRYEAIRSFYLRPSYLMRRLRRVKSWEHLANQLVQMAGLLFKNRA